MCEPMYSKREMYPTMSSRLVTKGKHIEIRNVLAYSNGTRTIFEISQKCNQELWETIEILRLLKQNKLVNIKD